MCRLKLLLQGFDGPRWPGDVGGHARMRCPYRQFARLGLQNFVTPPGNSFLEAKI